jgi:hypothetical protein
MPEALQVLQEVTRRFEEAAERTRPVPEATPPGLPRRLSVGMAVYDDFDGVFFTVEAIRLYHPELVDEVELIVVDNHPEGPAAEQLKRLEHKLPGYRYVPFRGYRGTAVRDLVFREAASELVACVDSHVLFLPGALAALVSHLDEHPDDLVHGPVHREDGSIFATHFEPRWSEGMYGAWARDERAADPGHPPFEIELSGLGVFACRRDRWPGFHPHFRGFGGEEGYLHDKFRRKGGRVVCHPAAGYVHRFARPSGLPYVNTWSDRIRNYMLGWSELGLDTSPIEHHFRAFLGTEVAIPLLGAAADEVANPLSFFDAILCLQVDERADDWPEVWQRFDALGMGRVVERFAAITTPDNHHAGCARSHRAMVAEAKRRGLRNVLVIEEDAIFRDDTLEVVSRALAELDGRDWDLLYLGGLHRMPAKHPPTPVAGCAVLEKPGFVTTSHAVAYNASAFDRILDEIPEGPEALDTWLTTFRAIDHYLPKRILDGAFTAFVMNPRVVAQPWMLGNDDAELEHAARFTIG